MILLKHFRIIVGSTGQTGMRVDNGKEFIA